MEYQEFKKTLLELLRKKTEGRKMVTVQQVEKNNGIALDAVVIMGKEDTIAPTIYLQEFYEEYKKGAEMERIAGKILALEKEQKQEADFSLESFENYALARTRVYYKLINYKMNQNMLKKVPHIRYLDLAVVFYYRLEGGKFHGATILIHNCNLESWGIDKRRLMEDAVVNTSRKLPYMLQGMEALIEELTGEETLRYGEEELMYVLTNEEKHFGAAVLLYPHVLSHIAKILRKNFYVLPSSVHECILVPDQGQYSRLELMKMVREVNESQVEEEEILSYEVYYYDRNKEALMM